MDKIVVARENNLVSINRTERINYEKISFDIFVNGICN